MCTLTKVGIIPKSNTPFKIVSHIPFVPWKNLDSPRTILWYAMIFNGRYRESWLTNYLIYLTSVYNPIMWTFVHHGQPSSGCHKLHVQCKDIHNIWFPLGESQGAYNHEETLALNLVCHRHLWRTTRSNSQPENLRKWLLLTFPFGIILDSLLLINP